MRHGNQRPTFEVVGEYASTSGRECAELFEAYGVEFYPSQKYELDLFLARDVDGRAASKTIGISKPRQNGKSFAARHYALWMAAAKTLLASNLTQTSMLGGYGVTAIDARTGQREYAPLRHSSTWVNVVYGSRWRPGLFAGYMKNLGTGKALASGELYGTGTDVDQLATGGVELTYNLPHWKVGAEYTYSAAWYGALNPSNGRITGSRSVGNHRGVVSVLYMF